MKSLRTGIILLGIVLAQTEGLNSKCFAHFNLASGQCEKELGMVDEDDCCQNPHYGFKDAAGVCHFCGPPVWTDWSPWSECSELCGDGVVQRTRKCHGLSECPNPQTSLEMKPCESEACCPNAVWLDWGAWSPCSVSCGAFQGQRRRDRVCSHQTPGCELTCPGPKDETESCLETQPCPVPGGWSQWSGWTVCSAQCIPGPFREDGSGVNSTRSRIRTCTNPSPSQHTSPAGKQCPGYAVEFEDCSELPNCPVDGSWGKWNPYGACSTPCGEGLKLSIRLCDNPVPEYGGKYCIGQGTQSAPCRNTCPVHGVVTGWSAWGECSATCRTGSAPIRTRHRTCHNPAPSSNPNGADCVGELLQRQECDAIPYCPVDGVWGPWGAYGSCSVTCGVGLRHSVRACDSPASKHGGLQCRGSHRREIPCFTDVHCPIDGLWSEWSNWSPCTDPKGRDIRCETTQGTQKRNRTCLRRAFGGALCPFVPGQNDILRGCYDIQSCPLKPAEWAGWSEWSLCVSKGNKMKSKRERICKPDMSKYSPLGWRSHLPMSFHGTAQPFCSYVPIYEKIQEKNCVNIPPST